MDAYDVLHSRLNRSVPMSLILEIDKMLLAMDKGMLEKQTIVDPSSDSEDDPEINSEDDADTENEDESCDIESGINIE